MKTLAWMLVIALAWIAPASAGPRDDRAAIEALEHKLGEVADPAEFKDFYAADAILYDGLSPGVYHGLDAIKAAFSAQLKDVKSVRTDFLELNVETSGDLAVAHSVQRLHVGTNDGKERPVICRVTDVFKRAKGQWKIAYQHISYPIDLTTGKGQFDFDPLTKQ